MKILTAVILIQLFFAVNCNGQSSTILSDSIAVPFERINRDMNIPCQFGVTFNKRENGRPFFTTTDSAQIEFDFYKFNIVPVLNPGTTILETDSAYYSWILQRNNISKAALVTKIYENKDKAYYVYKIQDHFGEFYQLVARGSNMLLSIKLFDNKMSAKDLLDKLDILYTINKN